MAVRIPGCDGFEGGLEPSVGFDPVQLGRLDERSDASLGGGAFVVTREQRVFFVRAISRVRFSTTLLSISWDTTHTPPLPFYP